MLLITEGNLEMKDERGVGQEIALGDGLPGESWLARTTFGELSRISILLLRRSTGVKGG